MLAASIGFFAVEMLCFAVLWIRAEWPAATITEAPVPLSA